MGTFGDKFGEVFRPFNTDGVPASGPYKPEKALAQALGAALDIAFASAVSGMATYAIQAALPTSPTPADGTQARVFDDPTPANNVVWVYKDGAWAIDSNFYNALSTVVQPLVDKAQAWAESATAPGAVGTKSAKSWVNYLLGDAGFIAIAADFALGAASKIGTVAADLLSGASKIASVAADLALGAGSSFIMRAPQAAIDATTAASAAATYAADFTLRQRGHGGRDVAVDQGQTTDQLQLRSLSRFDRMRNIVITPETISANAARMRKAVSLWGHSGIQGSGSSFSPNSDPYLLQTVPQTTPLPGRLQTLLGEDWRVFNNGLSAQTANPIAARMGAIPTFITVTGGSPVGTIPATGAVNCTLTIPWIENQGGIGNVLVATIGGVPVLIKAPSSTGGANPQHTVELYQGAAPLAVPDHSLIVPNVGDQDYAINIFQFDRNGQDLEKMKYLSGRMAAKVKGERRFIFIGTWNWRISGGEPVGSAGYNTTIAINDQYRAMWPQNFFDKRRFLRGDYPFDDTAEPSAWTVSGLTPTSADLTSIANGYEPDQFTEGYPGTLSGHNNDAGYDAMAKYLVNYRFPAMGWIYA